MLDRRRIAELLPPRQMASVRANNKNLGRHASNLKRKALKDLSAMPVYFAKSYSLVKPYVSGFDSNVLDTPSLKTVRINTSWNGESPRESELVAMTVRQRQRSVQGPERQQRIVNHFATTSESPPHSVTENLTVNLKTFGRIFT